MKTSNYKFFLKKFQICKDQLIFFSLEIALKEFSLKTGCVLYYEHIMLQQNIDNVNIWHSVDQQV